MRILITGGAGFVGSNLAKLFKEQLPGSEIVAFDNLKRRGSELNIPVFKTMGIQFQHGDVRSPADLADLNQKFDLVIDASAEPSVLSGLNGSPDYLLQTNLVGTLNCLEFARRNAGAMLFLSTSRVYSLAPLQGIKLEETATRFEISEQQTLPGISRRGIREDFPVHLPRSLYGATKLASECIAQEYANSYKFPVLINRCGVIAGPGQFGKVDQGVFTLWVMNHVFGKPLKYTGFGGQGKQVRDLLHPRDLFDLLRRQIETVRTWNGDVFNAGGGREISVSMQELTSLCREATGREVAIETNLETSPVDIPLYVTDSSKAAEKFGWKPRVMPRELIGEISQWVKQNQEQLLAVL